jgi:integrase
MKQKQKRDRGTGSIYQPKGRGGKPSPFFHICYYQNGFPVRESTKTAKIEVARGILNQRLLEAASGEAIFPNSKTVANAWEYLIADYTTREMPSLRNLSHLWKHLRPVFSKTKVKGLKYKDLLAYQQKMKTAGLANGTINQTLDKLKLALTFAVKAEELKTIPPFPRRLPENVRKGHITEKEYPLFSDLTLKHGGLNLRTIFEVAFVHARRLMEILTYRVGDIDFKNKTITTHQSKTNSTIALSVPPTMLNLLKACCEGKKPDDYVFTHKNGKRLKVLPTTWQKVCDEAGRPELIFHDLRRSSISMMAANGMPAERIMLISGHKSRLTFSRYQITFPAILRDDMERLEQVRQEAVNAEEGRTDKTERTNHMQTKENANPN